MDYEDYQKELDKIEYESNAKKRELHIRFAMENNTIQAGDVIKNGFGDIIKVDEIKIGISTTEKIPVCRYVGQKYTKKLKPYKSRLRQTIYQTNAVKKIG